MFSLLPEELDRYKQQIKLPSIGMDGQARLKQASVLCIGAGGLASPALLYLAAAGIGIIGIVDDDYVDLSNLQRQIIFRSEHAASAKAGSAKEQLENLNPHIKVNAYHERLTTQNVNQLIAAYDIIIDCSDNFSTRYLLNDACVRLNKPFVFGSVLEFEGQCSSFFDNGLACFNCLFPEADMAKPGLNCNQAGVLGVVPGVIGILQAAEVLKYLLNLGATLAGRLLTVNLLTMDFKAYTLQKNPHCQICSHAQRQQRFEVTVPTITIDELKSQMTNDTGLDLLDVRTLAERSAGHLGGIWIPYAELKQRVHELNPVKNWVIYCQSGVRSQYAADILLSSGFLSVKSLTGGMAAWRHCFKS